MTRTPTTVVIGAGMAGLACARTLRERNHDVVVLEATDRVGGRLGSTQIDGQWCDLGFQVSMSNYRDLESLVPRRTVARHPFIPGAMIWTGRSHVRLLDPRRAPLSALHSFLSGIVGLGDLRGATRCRRWASRTVAEPRVGTANDILREAGFSQRFQQTFLRPFFGGVFLDETLDVSADRFLRTLHRFATGHAELPEGGMQQLAEGMAAPIRADIQFDRAVASIHPGEGVDCTNGDRIEADHIVIATEFDQAMRLLDPQIVPPTRLWRSTIACHFSAPEPVMHQPLIALNGSGQGRINLVCSPSSVAPGYRTDGRHSIIVSLKPFAGNAPTVDTAAIAEEAGTVLGLDTSSWSWTTNTIISKGLPDPTAINPRPSPPAGVWIAGDWTGDPSIETAVHSGLTTARLITATG